MDKCELSVLGMSEAQYPGKGEIVSRNYTMFYLGGVKAEKGVAVVLRNVERVIKVESDRLIFVEISTKPFDILTVQVYMPKTDHDDEDMKKCMMKSVTYYIKDVRRIPKHKEEIQVSSKSP